jgi:hypothetical protein
MEARKEMTGLNLNKAVMISKMVEIKMNFSKIKRYARDYPKVVEYLESKGEKEGKEIKLKYRPLGRYDYFLYDYDNNEPTKGYYFKVNRFIDENFSDSLQENFYTKVYDVMAITDTSRGTGDEKYAGYPVGGISTASFRSPVPSSEASSVAGTKMIIDKGSDTTASSYVSSKDYSSMLSFKNTNEDAVDIEIPYLQFKKYIYKYPKIIKFIEFQYKLDNPDIFFTYNTMIKLKFRPYQNYDHFSFKYEEGLRFPDGRYLNFKVNPSVDGTYSNYLFKKYWDKGQYSKEKPLSVGTTKSSMSENISWIDDLTQSSSAKSSSAKSSSPSTISISTMSSEGAALQEKVKVSVVYKDFKNYIKNYKDFIKFIEGKIGENAKVKGYKIRLYYAPYRTYNWFQFIYQSGKEEETYDMLILNNKAEGNFAVYLYKKVHKEDYNNDMSSLGTSSSQSVSSQGTMSVKSTASSIGKRDTVKPNRLLQGWQGQ